MAPVARAVNLATTLPFLLTGNPVHLPFNCMSGLENWHQDWSQGKKEWCCQMDGTGCEHQEAAPARQALTVLPKPVTILPSNTASPYDCDADYFACETVWDEAKQGWCYHHAGRVCPAPSSAKKDRMAVPATAVVNTLKMASPESTMITNKVEATTSTISAECNQTCTFKGMPVSCKDRIQWSAEHEYFGGSGACSSARARVIDQCPVCASCQLPHAGCESFDCRLDIERWNEIWEGNKKSWCCENHGLGCQEGGSTYDCQAGSASWEKTWSPAKKTWCCFHTKRGCLQEGNLAVAEKDRCASGCDYKGMTVSCKDRILWSAKHEFDAGPQACSLALDKVRGQCPSCHDCDLESAHCDPYDCEADADKDWDSDHRLWCCLHRQRGCVQLPAFKAPALQEHRRSLSKGLPAFEPPALRVQRHALSRPATMPPIGDIPPVAAAGDAFDCHDASHRRWPPAKRTWCCEYKGLYCDSPSVAALPALVQVKDARSHLEGGGAERQYQLLQDRPRIISCIGLVLTACLLVTRAVIRYRRDERTLHLPPQRFLLRGIFKGKPASTGSIVTSCYTEVAPADVDRATDANASVE